MAEIHHFPAPPRSAVPSPGFAAGDRVRCPATAKTGTVWTDERRGVVTCDWDAHCGGGRFVRNADRLERLAPEHDPAVVVRLPGRSGDRVLRRTPDTGAPHWVREAPAGAGPGTPGSGAA